MCHEEKSSESAPCFDDGDLPYPGRQPYRRGGGVGKPAWCSAGEGTESEPYLISSYAQLNAFAAAVNGGDDMSDRVNYMRYKTRDITESVMSLSVIPG